LYAECQPPINFIFSSDTTKTVAYTGKLVNGKANGYGKGVFSNGNIYTGNWKIIVWRAREIFLDKRQHYS
jgi:hypothetical protein